MRARRCLKRKLRHLQRNICAYLSEDTHETNIPTWKRNKIFELLDWNASLAFSPVWFYAKNREIEFLLERIYKIVLRNIREAKDGMFFRIPGGVHGISRPVKIFCGCVPAQHTFPDIRERSMLDKSCAVWRIYNDNIYIHYCWKK